MTQEIVNRQMEMFRERDPAWIGEAVDWIVKYATTYPTYDFQSQDVSEWAHNNGFRKPPGSPKMWGSAIVQAAKCGIIYKVGYRNKRGTGTGHACPVAVWAKR